MNVRWPFAAEVTRPGAVFKRLSNSTVVWYWLYNTLRLMSAVILLPLVLHKLPTPELGMYYLLMSQVALVPLVDFGFGPTIGRFVSYAMGGAETIQAQGLAQPGKSHEPNYKLVWQLLSASRILYRYLTLALLVIVGIAGTLAVELRVNETACPNLTRLAWAATLLSTLFDIYSSYWGLFVLSMNQVLVGVRIGIVSYLLRLVVTGGLLVCGAGLLSMPLGVLSGVVVGRWWARVKCLQLLAGHPPLERAEAQKTFAILWPNSWRTGVQTVAGYLTANGNTQICAYALGLRATAQYGLSLQLVGAAAGMASVWTAVKWPLVGQYMARHDYGTLQRVLRPRVWLHYLSFLFMAAVLIVCGPYLLKWFGSGKQMLAPGWLCLMSLDTFLLLQFAFWGTLIFTQNRLPYLWPTVATSGLSLLLSLTLIHFTSLGVGALVLGPLFAGSLFNYWYWPPYAARCVGTTFFRFLFGRPGRQNTRAAVSG
jgi:hypothetical protein